MKYKYTYRNTAGELWQLSMYYTYGSMVGMCNLIFTAAVIALTINKWNTVSSVWRFLLLLACCLFTVIQPLVVWRKAEKQAAGIRRWSLETRESVSGWVTRTRRFHGPQLKRFLRNLQ